MSEAHVIIVGGGAAGIAAATRLIQNGFENVTLLEAEDRLGGRCNTVALGDEHVDLGAQWIHGEAQNVVHKMAASINLTKDSIVDYKNRFQFVLSNGKPMNSDVSKKILRYCTDTLLRITEQESPVQCALLLKEVNKKTVDENFNELEDFNPSGREVCQKEKMPSDLFLGEVYMNNFNDKLKDFDIFNQEIRQKVASKPGLSESESHTKSFKEKGDDLNEFNKAIHEKRKSRSKRVSMCEVYTKSYKENVEGLNDSKSFNQESIKSHQTQKFRSRRALSLGEVFMKSFHENLKDLEELNHHDQESYQEQPSNLMLSVGEVYMKSFNENQKDLNELRISNQEVRLILEWFHKLKNTEEASDSWYDVSFEGLLKYKECEGNQYVAWKSGGYSNIIDLLLQRIPKTKPEISLNVLYGKEVTHVVTSNHKVVVKCVDGSIYTADHIIICVSLGVLKHNTRMFSPPLPIHKQSAINNIALGVAEKLFIQFPHRWWPEDIASLNILLDAGAKEELQRISKKWLIEVAAFFVLDNAPNTLCGWVGGDAARYISTLPDNVLQDDLHYFLKRYYSGIYSIPTPVRFTRSNWYGNPHFRGAYSFVTVRANVLRSSSEDLADPIFDKSGKPVLMFAGEATHPHFFSTVHGAVETGWREADRILSYYKQTVSLKLINVKTMF